MVNSDYFKQIGKKYSPFSGEIWTPKQIMCSGFVFNITKRTNRVIYYMMCEQVVSKVVIGPISSEYGENYHPYDQYCISY